MKYMLRTEACFKEDDKITTRYKIQIASDIIRNGLGAELLDANNNVLAELFRCDNDNTIIVNTFKNDIPMDTMRYLIKNGAERLGDFENGTPISQSDV